MKKKKLVKSKSKSTRKQTKEIRIPHIISVLLIAGVLFMTVFLVQQQQSIRQEAAPLPAPAAMTNSPVFNCMGSCPTMAPEPSMILPSLKQQQGVANPGEEPVVANPANGVGEEENLPPGLQNRGDKPLPPGIAKKVANGQGGGNPFSTFMEWLQQLIAQLKGSPNPQNPIQPESDVPGASELPSSEIPSSEIPSSEVSASVTPGSGCTLTIGFWKTHAGFGPQEDVLTPHLPIWLGTPNGDNSIQVTTAAQAVEILQKSGDASNGINGLNAQLLGSKLNLQNGADAGGIDIGAMDTFLAAHAPSEWASLDAADKQQVNSWATTMDNYNNGLTGPGHCQ